MSTTGTDTPGTGRRDDDPRFTKGLVLDVARAIESHGYPAFSGREMVELQQHLFHLLHGRPGRCGGRRREDCG